MDLQRANQWAGVGSFFVGVIGLVAILYPLVLPRPAPADNASQPKQDQSVQREDPAGQGPRMSQMEWVGVSLIVIGMVAGGALHWLAARQMASAPSSPRPQHPHTSAVPPKPPTARAGVPESSRVPGSFAREIEWQPVSQGDVILIEVKNVNPTGPTKTGVTVWLDNVQEWCDGHPVKVRAYEEAPKGGTLQLAQGQRDMFFRDVQRYALVTRHDESGRLRVLQMVGNHQQPFLLHPGLWIAVVRVEWDGRSESRNVCFRSEGGKKPPTIEPCPESARTLSASSSAP